MGEALERLPLGLFFPVIRLVARHWLLVLLVVAVALLAHALPRRASVVPWLVAGVVATAWAWQSFSWRALLIFLACFFAGFLHVGLRVQRDKEAVQRQELLARFAADVRVLLARDLLDDRVAESGQERHL